MKHLISFASFLVTVIIPVFIIMTSIRLMFTPLFLQFEYNRPDFPVDIYGFSTADRLKYGGLSMQYLLNRSGIDFLEEINLADGSPLYNQRELSHMLDVKILLQNMIIAWIILFILLMLIGVWAWRSNWLKKFCLSWSYGGWLTLGLIFTILLGVALSFNWLFTNFHLIFFSGDTWLFSYSDSLIRLFPLNLWQDAFIGLGIITIILAIISIWQGRRLYLRL